MRTLQFLSSASCRRHKFSITNIALSLVAYCFITTTMAYGTNFPGNALSMRRKYTVLLYCAVPNIDAYQKTV